MRRIIGNKIFENIFNDIHIIDSRLFNFGSDALARLGAANGGGDYTALINLIKTPLGNMGTDLGLVDTSLTIQIGATLTNNQVLAAFRLTMSQKEGVIADALGGRTTPAYLEFYPHKISEYANATKVQMPTLTNRVNVAATAHSAELGATLTALLQGYQSSWATSREDQETQFGTVDENRTARDSVRTDLQLVLLTGVHTIAAKFPGDVKQCLAFFDFNLLYAQKHRKYTTYEGTIPVSGQVTILNKELTDTNTIDAHNPDDNADYVIYLGINDEAQPGPKAITLKAGTTINEIKPSTLGDLKNTFLMVKNLSTVNEGAYEITIGEVHRRKDTPGKGVIN